MQLNEHTTYWHCPAKLNLFLHITGRRQDGYHLLQSVFQMLDYGDLLAITPRADADIGFDCSISALASDDNLVVRAARTLQQAASINRGADIYLYKRLPAGGGIGGGSSDAATTLLALNELWQCGLTAATLSQLGLELGADIPFFIHRQTAFVEGIGERVTPINLPQKCFLVVHPKVSVSTAEIFSDPLLTRNSKAITIRDLDAMGLPQQGFNSLQSVVCSRYPEVEKALDWLRQVEPNARMSGSGSCVFATFDNEEKVRKIASRCEWPHFVAKGVERSDIHLARSDWQMLTGLR